MIDGGPAVSVRLVEGALPPTLSDGVAAPGEVLVGQGAVVGARLDPCDVAPPLTLGVEGLLPVSHFSLLPGLEGRGLGAEVADLVGEARYHYPHFDI